MSVSTSILRIILRKEYRNAQYTITVHYIVQLYITWAWC